MLRTEVSGRQAQEMLIMHVGLDADAAGSAVARAGAQGAVAGETYMVTQVHTEVFAAAEAAGVSGAGVAYDVFVSGKLVTPADESLDDLEGLMTA